MATWILGPDSNGDCCACRPAVCTDCTCPAPTLRCDSISASLTKCGFDEWSGHVSSPPKIYLTTTLSGTLTAQHTADALCALCNDKTTYAYSGTCSFARPSCSETDTGNQHVVPYPDCVTPGSSSDSDVCDLPPLAGFTDSYTSTVHTQTGDGCDGGVPSENFTGSATATLSSEYTTALLISDTVAALPSYPGTFSGTCSSLRNLSSDELTYSIRRFKYKFVLPDLTGFSCYSISWMEGSTPRSYTWNGTDTETPVYGPVNEPGSNGTVDITGITASCVC